MKDIVSVYDNKKDCCGCACCVNICPKNAIYMKEDEYGYKYPTIDKDICINCGLCKNVCKYQKEGKELHQCQKVYAAITENKEIIKKSASGGIFANIAKNFIEDNGVVYGCAMNYRENKLYVEHIRIDKTSDLIKLQGSKYVQSNIEKIYVKIENDLKQNKKVLFSGTPCQVDAIKEYLKKKNIGNVENLYCIDIICHGVPNHKMFNEYIKLLEKKYKGKIIDFRFRHKTKKGGKNALAKVEKKNGVIKNIIIPAYKSSFYQLFLDSETLRENCYECPYALSQRIGNITIGDYWKIEIEHKNEIDEKHIDINNGVSCVLVNTEKGNCLINKYGNDLNYIDSDFEKVSKHNKQLVGPSKEKNREKILKLYKENKYKSIDKYYWKKNLKKIVMKKLWYKVPFKIRTKIK